MYDAPVVAVAIGGTDLLRCALLRLERHFEQSGRSFPLVLHWYTWYYLFCFTLSAVAIRDMFYNVMQPTAWLDPAATEEYAQLTLQHEKGAYALWQQEASLEGYDALRYLSLSSPLWLLGTFAVSVYHTRLHVLKIRSSGSGLGRALLRDSTIRILGLPMCYCLMSFKSVLRMWQLCINHMGITHYFSSQQAHSFGSYEARRDFVLQMYEANFMVRPLLVLDVALSVPSYLTSLRLTPFMYTSTRLHPAAARLLYCQFVHFRCAFFSCHLLVCHPLVSRVCALSRVIIRWMGVQVGDIYEAYALAIFGALLIDVLRKKMAQHAEPQPSSQERLGNITPRIHLLPR